MDIVGALLLGLISGFVSALSTGGGFIAVPGLILLGAPPISAIATSRFSAVGAALSSTARYQKGKAISWHYVPYFVPLALVAGLLGPHILLSLDREVVEQSIAIIMLALLPLMFTHKNLGTKTKLRKHTHKIIGFVLLFIVLLYATMFGGGSGILFLYVLVYLYGMKIVEANATCTVLGLIGSGVAIVIVLSSLTLLIA